MIDVWRLTEKHGARLSFERTFRIARSLGATFDDKAARALLQKFTPVAPDSHRGSTPVNEHKYPGGTGLAPDSHRGSRARSKGIPSSKASFLSPNGDSHVGDAAPSEPVWVTNLRHAIAEIDKLPLSGLTVEQRVTLGRYHALRFENYAASEAKNRNRGVKHVAPLADLGGGKYGDVTVAEYRAYLQHLMAASGSLIRSPWALKGAIEMESA